MIPRPSPVTLHDADHERQALEAAIERLLAAVERALADLDALDGDADLEPDPDLEGQCEDEGAQCDDEGCDPDQEDGGDAEPDAPSTTGTYHPDDQRLIVSGGFAGRTFYFDVDAGRTVPPADANPSR